MVFGLMDLERWTSELDLADQETVYYQDDAASMVPGLMTLERLTSEFDLAGQETVEHRNDVASMVFDLMDLPFDLELSLELDFG